MVILIILFFVIGYLAIAFEHSLKLNKTVTALLMASLIWVALAIGFSKGWLDIINPMGHVFNIFGSDAATQGFNETLLHHFGSTSEILIFLIGAMTIVEIIDMHNGFGVLKKVIRSKKKRELLWIVGVIGFVLSSVIDNLTATIVLVTLVQKLIPTRKERIWFASLIIIATNAGGAWSPIGDVTTIMLWIGKKVTGLRLISYVVVPSIICFIVPFLIASYLPLFKGNVETSEEEETEEEDFISTDKIILFLGLGMIIFVPVFKSITGLPPYLGMMFSLAIVWMVSEFIQPQRKLGLEGRLKEPTHTALTRIDMPSTLFFLGILMAVAGLEVLVSGVVSGESVGTLRHAAEMLRHTVPNEDVVVLFLGVLSAVIDNVPLVAATMGMYEYPMDAEIWHFIAYSAGTGGSMLIIGSAAGVAAMGMEHIDFIWYLKKISWLAFVGFISGAAAFLLIERVIFG